MLSKTEAPSGTDNLRRTSLSVALRPALHASTSNSLTGVAPMALTDASNSSPLGSLSMDTPSHVNTLVARDLCTKWQHGTTVAWLHVTKMC